VVNENNSPVNIRIVAKTSDIRNFSENIRSVSWPMRATLKNFFWHFLKKKTFQKLKQFYFRFGNICVSQMFSK